MYFLLKSPFIVNTLKDFKNTKNENYYFLNPEHVKYSFTIKSAGNDTLHLSIPKTGIFIDNGHHQLRIRDLLFFAHGVPTNQ